jgi:hypothetical protein
MMKKRLKRLLAAPFVLIAAIVVLFEERIAASTSVMASPDSADLWRALTAKSFLLLEQTISGAYERSHPKGRNEVKESPQRSGET